MLKLQTMMKQLNQIVWGNVTIFLLLLLGSYFCYQLYHHNILRISSIRKEMKKIMFQKNTGVSGFSALSTALGATLGVGSIVGVASAIMIGGAGSLFWMWICGLIGMGLKYAETIMAMKHRKKQKDGSYLGGAFYALEDHGLPLLGVLFALFCIFASFGIGNAIPIYTIKEAVTPYIPSIWFMIILVLVLSICLFFGSSCILKMNEYFVPVFSFLYIVACLYLIMIHIDILPSVLLTIVKDAFCVKSTTGGVFGLLSMKALHYGISRGVFSHEAGMGSAPLAHASVSHHHIQSQGCLGIIEVFVDTMVICTLSALAFLLCKPGFQGSAIELCLATFQSGFGEMGAFLFRISLVSFAFSSILGWVYYAFAALRYLFPNRFVISCYCVLFILFSIVSCIMKVDFLWEFADTCNGLMMLPNLLGIWICRKEIIDR